MAHSRNDLKHLAGDVEHRLGRQLASLGNEASDIIEQLGKISTRTSRSLGHVAHNAADDFVHTGSRFARSASKQALGAGRAVGRDPVPAVIAVFGIACLLRLLLGRSAHR